MGNYSWHEVPLAKARAAGKRGLDKGVEKEGNLFIGGKEGSREGCLGGYICFVV